MPGWACSPAAKSAAAAAAAWPFACLLLFALQSVQPAWLHQGPIRGKFAGPQKAQLEMGPLKRTVPAALGASPAAGPLTLNCTKRPVKKGLAAQKVCPMLPTGACGHSMAAEQRSGPQG